MGFVWNPFGFPGVLTGAAALAIAGLVYFTRASRFQNRVLALVLFLEATVAVTGTGLMFLTDSYATAYALQAVTVVALLSIAPAYLAFISTLDTPLARPLRARAVRTALLVAALALPVAWFVARGWFVVGLYQSWFAPWEIIPGPGWFVLLALDGVAYLYGLAAAVSAWRRAAVGSLARARGRAFAIAFGTRDVAWTLLILMPMVVPSLAPSTHWGSLVYAAGPPAIQLLYLPLLGYGILKTQLFDIDVRIKRGVRRSVIAGAFLLAFFVVGAVAEGAVQSRTGYVAGLVAAVALAFAFRPLERFAGRLADRAMPRVREDPDFLGSRKLEVYKAALESAAPDGVVSQRERAVLATLRDKLGIAAGDAEAIECDVLGRAVVG
ncbi:MAG TPA: hypothetical protein VI997_04700 [Candidatus Thermoplasmatota archaeon]|nr:hypothetical protein [Candidatus Thermoplasmatota archaeon]